MKKHVHSEQIMQFARMIAAGYPIDKLVQRLDANRDRGEFVLPHWDTDCNYHVACAFIDDMPVFEDAEVYLGEQAGYIRWGGTHVVFENTNLL